MSKAKSQEQISKSKSKPGKTLQESSDVDKERSSVADFRHVEDETPCLDSTAEAQSKTMCSIIRDKKVLDDNLKGKELKNPKMHKFYEMYINSLRLH